MKAAYADVITGMGYRWDAMNNGADLRTDEVLTSPQNFLNELCGFSWDRDASLTIRAHAGGRQPNALPHSQEQHAPPEMSCIVAEMLGQRKAGAPGLFESPRRASSLTGRTT